MATATLEESPPIQQETTACLPDNNTPNTTGEIDSALLSALRDPRERLGLLKLEQTMMDFLNSPDLYWDVGGSANSLVRNSNGEWIASGPFRPQTTFQRCLLHRLGDRFGIRREPQEDGFIRIFKTPASTLPDQLLLNVPERELSLPDTSKPRKMKIMKRSSSSNISTGSSNSKSRNNINGNKSSTQTDKERQYAEARARIFQQSQEEAMAETFDPIESTTTTTTTTSASSSSSLLLSSPLTPTAPEFVPAGADPTKPNKATWRNRQSELNDPDFQRRRTPAFYGFVNPSIVGSTPPLPPSSSLSSSTVAGSLPLSATTPYYPSSTPSMSSGYPYSTTTTATTTNGYFTTRPSSSTTPTAATSSSNIPNMNFQDFPSLR